ELALQRLCGYFAPVIVEHQSRAFCSERSGDGGTNSARGAGHEDDPSIQVSFHKESLVKSVARHNRPDRLRISAGRRNGPSTKCNWFHQPARLPARQPVVQHARCRKTWRDHRWNSQTETLAAE